MTKPEMRTTICECKARRQVCNVYLKYDHHYWNLVPLSIGKNLVLFGVEDDFILNGYTVRRFQDLAGVKAKDDMCGEILKREGIIDAMTVPAVSVASWESVFSDLKSLGENVIVESESLKDDECDFVIGRIEKVYRHFAYIQHFDADGIWQDSLRRMSYTDITSVTFDSRYVRIFSKYLNEPAHSVRQGSLNVWTSRSREKRQDNSGSRSGLRLVFDSGVDAEVRRACKEFCRWLCGEFQFPIRVPVYIKAHRKLRAMDGDTVCGTFFGPDDIHVEPYIRVAAGDYAEMAAEWGQDKALASILETIAHELTHYFQWLNGLKLTPRGEERQAISYAGKILDDYAAIREHP